MHQIVLFAMESALLWLRRDQFALHWKVLLAIVRAEQRELIYSHLRSQLELVMHGHHDHSESGLCRIREVERQQCIYTSTIAH